MKTYNVIFVGNNSNSDCLGMELSLEEAMSVVSQKSNTHLSLHGAYLEVVCNETGKVVHTEKL